MKKLTVFLKISLLSLAISISTVVFGGFPVFYYLPAGDDYGASFYKSEFLINTVLVFVGIMIIYFIAKKFKKKTSE